MLHPENTEEEKKKKEKEERRKKKKKEERRSAKLGNTEEYEDIQVCGEPRDVPCGNPFRMIAFDTTPACTLLPVRSLRHKISLGTLILS